MADQDKAAHRSMIIFQLGQLLAPLIELADRSPPPPPADYQITSARGSRDCMKWAGEVSQFTQIGTINLAQLANQITQKPHNLFHDLTQMAMHIPDDIRRQAELRARLDECRQDALKSIDLVPIEWEAKIHNSETPFAVYLCIRDAIATAKQRVHYFDRYLTTDFFDVYLRDLDRTLEIRAITTSGGAKFGVANVRAVSKIAAGEFGKYQLIECKPADLHDRNLRIDDKVFFLGTSITSAGAQPTNFAPADRSSTGHGVLDSIIAKGTVIT